MTQATKMTDVTELEPPSIDTSLTAGTQDDSPSFVKRLVNKLKSLRGASDHKKLRDTLEDYLDKSNAPLDERELGIASNERAMMSNILKLNDLTAHQRCAGPY